MVRLAVGVCFGIVISTALGAALGAHADPAGDTPSAASVSGPSFQEGFLALHDQLGSIMGRPLEDEHPAPDAEAVQRTSTGLAVWRKGDSPSFTDGSRVWTLDRPALPPSPIIVVANARVKCIEEEESHGENVWHGHTPPPPGTDKPGGVLQYFGGTFARGAAELGHPEWSRWVPWQAEAVAAHDLAMGRRSQWTVGGC